MAPRFLGLLFVFLISFSLLLSATRGQVMAQGLGESKDELQKKLDENRKEQERINHLLGDTRQKKLTLQNEISYQDNQIRLTLLKIEETQGEIDKLTGQIDQLEGVLTDLSNVFAARAVETYKLARVGDSVLSLLAADNISEFISRFQYLQRLQQNDRELLLQMQASQTNYENQRTKVEVLQSRLHSEEKTLAVQRGQKQKLLEVTKNDEKKYQELLASLRADEAAIERAISSLIARIIAGLATGTPVTKGQIIAQEGNTGYVFPRPSGSCPQCGYHLHFMVLPCDVTKNASLSCHTDPTQYLNDGQYRKPLDFQGNWDDKCGDRYCYVTQWYGYTSFAQSGAYNGAPHSGIDLQTSWGAPIYAIDAGTVYYGTDSGGGKYALIKHKDDLWSAYWHLQ